MVRASGDLVRLAGMASLVWALACQEWVNAALFSLVLLGLVVPRFLATLPALDLVYSTVLLFAAWSAVLDLYVTYDRLDGLVHAVVCGLTAFFALRVLVGSGILPAPADHLGGRARTGVWITTTALGWSLGVLWELGEWFGHTYLDDRIQVGYHDTVSDLTADGLGALLAGLVLAWTARPRAGSRPVPAASTETTVSVVIPVKDDAVALERCLRLLRSQTVQPLEVVVVDNASTDNSAQVAAGLGARVVHEPSPGIPAAAAAGYDAARGQVIARCDADSRPPADWLERIVRRMAAEPRLDALTGTGRFYDLPPGVALLTSWAYLGSYYVLVHAALGHTPVWGSNMAIRRQAWQEVSALVHRGNPELHDDMDLAFALGPRRKVRYDRGLVVGVSGRSVRGRRQLDRRVRRAFHTLRENWQILPPWTRWRTRFEGHRAGVP